MINVKKEETGGVTRLTMDGSIEESVSFDQLIGAPTGEIQVFCKGITRINSIGVKSWISYFQGLTAKGAKLKFFECSTAIVEQINLITNFTCGGVVESMQVPFVCEKCNMELVAAFQAKDLAQAQFNIPELKCPKCGGASVFDDVTEEYFGFLMNK